MPIPDGFVGRSFRLSGNVADLHVRKIGGGKSHILIGPVVTFEADDDVNIAALLRSRALAPVDDEPKSGRRGRPETTEAQPGEQAAEGG